MANIPGGIDKTAQEVPSLVLNGVGNVGIQGDTLYVSTGSQTAAIDLHGSTVMQVASQMPPGITANVEQDGMAELLMLPYQAQYMPIPVTLNIAQSPLWIIVGSMARMLEARRRSLQQQVKQLDIVSATSMLLDWWGATLGVERITGEPDLLYAQRIVGMKFRPNVNNIALQQFFQSLGYTTQVIDASPGVIDVYVNLPDKPPSGFYYTTDQLQQALYMVKAAGIIANFILEGNIQDNISVTDSNSPSIHDPTQYRYAGWTCSLLGVLYVIPSGAWVWGTGQWIGEPVTE